LKVYGVYDDELGMTQRELAEGIKTSSQRINDLVNGRRGITPSTALRLAKFFDTTPDFWMNMQLRWDLYETQRDEREVLATIKKFPMPAQQVSAD
jgi:antitoxin HigA-1